MRTDLISALHSETVYYSRDCHLGKNKGLWSLDSKDCKIENPAQLRQLKMAACIGCLGGSMVSVAAFGPRGREFDVHSLLRFQLPSEA